MVQGSDADHLWVQSSGSVIGTVGSLVPPEFPTALKIDGSS